MVKIRLMRTGAKKKPFYRIVAADSRAPRDGKFLEILGYYDPRKKPHILEVKTDRVKDWIEHGAQLTERVEKLISKLA
ncbi:MAG TPA: 30S ribosomal protein S16 [Thermodesulfobacteriota bacterium]|nr:30S ribosomal protein S16 [Thermodesulfobacteriota bacterium]